MSILVTGGAGFIGSYTVDLLIDKGYDVAVLDNYERQVHAERPPKHVNSKAKYIKEDVRYLKSWEKALDGVEYVIHLAGAVGVVQSFWETRKYVSVNTLGTANLYQFLITHKEVAKRIKKIVVASSKSIYGEGAYLCKEHGVVYPSARPVEQLRRKDWEAKCPICREDVAPVGIKEEKPPQVLNPYALSKYDQERLAIDYAGVLGIPTVAFRYFNVYGPRQSLRNPYTGVMAIFLSRLKNGNPPLLFEDGKQMRDFVYVEDVAKLNVMALEKGEGVYNLGTGKPTSLLKIVNAIKELLGSHVEPKVTQDFRPSGNRHNFADLTRMKRDFGGVHLHCARCRHQRAR
ncbi:MAG: SDR family NAD(P)-dependent oxidoreductase [Thermoprotei archaeon]